MVLRLKARESRSLPGLANPKPDPLNHDPQTSQTNQGQKAQNQYTPTNAGWSSLVARQAHNLKVAGSNPAPATKVTELAVLPVRAALSYVPLALSENAARRTVRR